MKRSIYHQIVGALTAAGETELVQKLQAAVEEKTPLQESNKEKPLPTVEGSSIRPRYANCIRCKKRFQRQRKLDGGFTRICRKCKREGSSVPKRK